jgi:microcystin-dependent protein
MGQPFVGEIRMFGGNFAPAGWMFCDGQLLPISENEVLFQLIGTTYGGDGQETFALPNLQSRIPLHFGTGSDGISYTLGEAAGVEQVTLTTQQTPIHTHALLASLDPQNATNPTGSLLAQPGQIQPYIESTANTAFNANAVTPAGGSQPHENMMPFLCISFIISLFGIFPPQS